MPEKITPQKILVFLVIINLIIGVLIAPDFGRTPDEDVEYLRATAALKAFTPGSIGQYSDNQIPITSRFYGTAMTMLAHLAERIFQPVLGTEAGVIIHYIYFVFFQIGIVSIFFLSKKFFSEWTALIITILFNTQPLYFGHSFINPKDIPLLSIFLAAVTLGIYMADNLIANLKISNKDQPTHIHYSFSESWSRTPPKTKRLLQVVHLIWPILLGLYLLVQNNIPKLVELLYTSPPGSIFGTIFDLVADQSSTTDLASYINKTSLLNQRVFQITGGVIGLFILMLYLKKIPDLWEYIRIRWVSPVINDFKPKNFIPHLTNLNILTAGLLWGWCLSTRVVGIFVGGIIGLYLLLQIGKRAVAPLFIYTVISLTTTYLSFPQLWTNGFSKLSKGLSLFSAYIWDSGVFFNGTKYVASELPRSYLPFFFTTQFTEPLLILSSIGLIIGLRKALKNTVNWKLLLVISSWFLLPLGYVLIKHPNLYNNCRQFLFITPPLFILAGIGLEKLLLKLKIPLFRVLLICAVLFPGILSIIQLHPYQYIYYNEFIGGVDGAFRSYEMDYWAASSAEAIKYLNQIAPENSSVIAWIYPSIIEFYAREDLVIIHQKNITENISSYDYAIINSQFNADVLNLQNQPSIFIIERNDAVFTVVKAINHQE